ncbi:hypothetical protein [Caudoviricetes sp.]|nr:hypothetical protein [Caudoviricetes sp.]
MPVRLPMDPSFLGSGLGGFAGLMSGGLDEYQDSDKDVPSYLTSMLKPTIGGGIGAGLGGLATVGAEGKAFGKKTALIRLLKKMGLGAGMASVFNSPMVAGFRAISAEEAAKGRKHT